MNEEILPTKYDPTQTEKKLYQWWDQEGLFHSDINSQKEKFVMVMPPPNVTGVLHIGHALTMTLEDLIIRRKRMQGFNVLWIPGTDHAGIATQMVVERHLLQQEKKTKEDLGRQAFVQKIWDWKKQSESTILSQLKMMGSSTDWRYLHFTLDEDVSFAVKTAFKRLYDEELIYQDTLMIQWCPRCKTALSDLEVKPRETKSTLYHIQYPVFDSNSSLTSISVATTRPETLFGDVAIAVNPADLRLQAYVGKTALIPLAQREIPIIADSYVDSSFGTGALKITPAHDPNDYEIGKKRGLPVLSIFDDEANLLALDDLIPKEFQKLSREKARQKVVAILTQDGKITKEIEHKNNVSVCDRCSTVVEPKLSRQWFINAKKLAEPAIEAVKQKKIRILPLEWEKNYFQWMENIRPWCISRQLWWGHQIPVWYCEVHRHPTCSIAPPTKCSSCESTKMTQDSDVLDTWFSSGLWPFSTLGWPNETKSFAKFYPNDFMETGFDILFFWVARMIMLGIKMTGQPPFHTVYLHPMVRDEFGQKMSKTKGNVKDPLEIIHRIGADPLRFTLAAMSVHGRDVLLSDERMEGYRNFMNKIWNASRFVLMHFGNLKQKKIEQENEINLWIHSRLNVTKREVNRALDECRFFDAANRIYDFFCKEYCDWFLEFIKPELEERKKNLDSTAVLILEEALRLLHPFMPFITEEIWQKILIKESVPSISIAKYPKEDLGAYYPEIEKKIALLISVVDAIRSKRGESNLSPAKKIDVYLFGDHSPLRGYEPILTRLAGIQTISFSTNEKELVFSKFIVIPLPNTKIAIPKNQLLNLIEENQKTEKELKGKREELFRAKKKLDSHEFCTKAPKEVLEGVKRRKEELEKEIVTLEVYLQSLQES